MVFRSHFYRLTNFPFSILNVSVNDCIRGGLLKQQFRHMRDSSEGLVGLGNIHALVPLMLDSFFSPQCLSAFL